MKSKSRITSRFRGSTHFQTSRADALKAFGLPLLCSLDPSYCVRNSPVLFLLKFREFFVNPLLQPEAIHNKFRTTGQVKPLCGHKKPKSAIRRSHDRPNVERPASRRFNQPFARVTFQFRDCHWKRQESLRVVFEHDFRDSFVERKPSFCFGLGFLALHSPRRILNVSAWRRAGVRRVHFQSPAFAGGGGGSESFSDE